MIKVKWLRFLFSILVLILLFKILFSLNVSTVAFGIGSSNRYSVPILCTIIKISYGNGAMVHLGTTALYTFAILFGGFHAGFAGAIGSSCYNILFGFSPYTFWPFFIKGIAGFIAGSIAAAVTNIPSSLITSGVGLVAAIPLSTAIRSAMKRSGINIGQ